MTALFPIRHRDDVLPVYRGTPVADLVAYHNLRSAHRSYDQAELLIGMCMNNRIALRIPDNFAYVLRAGRGNLQRIEFKVSYAVAVGGVRTICLIGHDQCGMVGLRARRGVFANGLVENGGWARREAERHFAKFSAVFEMGDPAAFALREARPLRKRYARLMVAPFIYQVRDGLLYQIVEDEASGVGDGY
jgi:carbonic anhydrase